MKNKIILSLAMSLDGYISEEDGGFDWIKGQGDKSCDTKGKFDMVGFINSIDIIVMGKNAYLDCPDEGMKMFKNQKIYVASSEKLDKRMDNVEFIEGDICKKILDLEDEGWNIWIYGGGISADYFIKKDIVDEFIIAIVPIVLGKGKPLFLEDNPTIKLHLDELSSQEGMVVLKYSKRK